MKAFAAAYAKFLAAASAALGVLVVAVEDGQVTAKEWVSIAIAVVGALGVHALPNKPQA